MHQLIVKAQIHKPPKLIIRGSTCCFSSKFIFTEDNSVLGFNSVSFVLRAMLINKCDNQVGDGNKKTS